MLWAYSVTYIYPVGVARRHAGVGESTMLSQVKSKEHKRIRNPARRSQASPSLQGSSQVNWVPSADQGSDDKEERGQEKAGLAIRGSAGVSIDGLGGKGSCASAGGTGWSMILWTCRRFKAVSAIVRNASLHSRHGRQEREGADEA